MRDNITIGEKIVLENAKTFREKDSINHLNNRQVLNLNSIIMQKMYKEIISLNKSIDFTDIDRSMGKVSKVEDIRITLDLLDTLDDIASHSNNIKLKSDVETLQKAMSFVISYDKYFNAGYKSQNDFVITTYRCIIKSCIEATTLVAINSTKFDVKTFEDSAKIVAVESLAIPQLSYLKDFIISCKNGHFAKQMRTSLNEGSKNLLGTATIVTGIIAGSLTIIPTLRYLVYSYYNSRMQLSDYINAQVKYLEANKLALQASGVRNTTEKNKILNKQNKAINQLNNISEKIKVDFVIANKKSELMKKNNSKNYSIDNQDVDYLPDDNAGMILL